MADPEGVPVPEVERWSPEALAYLRGVGQRPGRPREEDEPDPWALPLIVRLERTGQPGHTPVLAAAAQATAQLLLDPRAAPGGPWHEPVAAWLGRRIRKVTRRARGVRWVEAEALDGSTARLDGAEVRALLPHRMAEPPAPIAKMQVAGLELSDEVRRQPARHERGPVLVVATTPEVEMTTGKAAAQVGHAAQLALTYLDERAARRWAEAGFPVDVVDRSPRAWAALLDDERRGAAVVVRDGGFTEVAPGTRTAAAAFLEPAD